MKNAKKLLAIAIALVMLVSTLVSGLVVSAATPGSLTVAETTTVEVGEQAIVNFNINFGETPVNALHMLATITSDLAIVDAELGAVTYPNGEPVVDDELESPALRLDTKNLEAGKILFESGVDGAVTVTDVNFTVTFAAAEAAGDYAFAINVESTDYDEADFDAMTANGTIHVHAYEAVVTDPTCTEAGYTTYTCACGDSYTGDAVDALGHSYDDGVVDPEPTCEGEGVITYTCGVCGDSYTEAVDPTGHTAAEELVNNEDGTHSEVCGVCGAILSTADCEYVDGFCACGAAEPVTGPVEDPNLVIAGASMSFGTSSLEMNFRIRNSVLTLADYDRVDLVIIPQKYDSTTKNLVETPEEIVISYEELSGTGTFRTYAYSDMMLYGLALNIDYKLQAYVGDELVAVSQDYSQSPVSYLKGLISNDSVADNLKTVAADMLVVCEEARIAMSASAADSDLAAASKVTVLDDSILAIATPSVGETNTVNNFEPIVDGWGTTYTITPSVAIEKVPVVNLRIKDSKAFDLDKLSIKVSYTSSGAAGYVERTLESSDLTRAGNYITTRFSEVGLHDSNADITFEFSYDDAVTGTLTYSIETYLTTAQTNATLGDLATALIKLGSSFRTFKGL